VAEVDFEVHEVVIEFLDGEVRSVSASWYEVDKWIMSGFIRVGGPWGQIHPVTAVKIIEVQRG
jgi:hypothetical protein